MTTRLGEAGSKNHRATFPVGGPVSPRVTRV